VENVRRGALPRRKKRSRKRGEKGEGIVPLFAPNEKKVQEGGGGKKIVSPKRKKGKEVLAILELRSRDEQKGGGYPTIEREKKKKKEGVYRTSRKERSGKKEGEPMG